MSRFPQTVPEPTHLSRLHSDSVSTPTTLGNHLCAVIAPHEAPTCVLQPPPHWAPTFVLQPPPHWAPTCVLQQLPQRQEGAVDSLLGGRPRQAAHGLLKEAIVPLHPVAGLTLLHQAQTGLHGAGQLACACERPDHFLREALEAAMVAILTWLKGACTYAEHAACQAAT